MFTNYKFGSKAQVALPFILLIGGIIAEIVIAGSIVSFFVNASSVGEQLSTRALIAANAGVQDAMARVSSNKEFASTETNYSITVGSDSVSVTVSRTVDNSKNIYEYTINSVAIARNKQRKLTAQLVVNQDTGRATVSSIQEQSVL